jgi:molybdopterin-guanine dinucleotide biosynthesis protein A
VIPSADTAVILCGSESRRARFDKRLHPFERTILPVALARKLGRLFPQIIVVTNSPPFWLSVRANSPRKYS